MQSSVIKHRENGFLDQCMVLIRKPAQADSKQVVFWGKTLNAQYRDGRIALNSKHTSPVAFRREHPSKASVFAVSQCLRSRAVSVIILVPDGMVLERNPSIPCQDISRHLRSAGPLQ
jgi:hypothetical protein